jgi:hypothetical protein
MSVMSSTRTPPRQYFRAPIQLSHPRVVRLLFLDRALVVSAPRDLFDLVYFAEQVVRTLRVVYIHVAICMTNSQEPPHTHASLNAS